MPSLSKASKHPVRSTAAISSFFLIWVAAFSVFAGQTKGQTAETQQPTGVDQSQSIQRRSPTVENAAHHDVSVPLVLMTPAPRQKGQRVHSVKPLPRPASDGATGGEAVNLPVQPNITTALAPTTLLNFDGIGSGFSGPSGSFTVASAPPDPAGDVGPNHYVQIVNTDFAIFNKSGTAIFGPVPINTLWSGFGGGCQVNNDGDAVVVYDSIADRWVITQFSVSTTPFLQCVAVSQTPDPTGAYNRYSFSYAGFNDYPKLGVWPDGYYATFNLFDASGSAFAGGLVCAYDRTKMLTGQAATQQCFNVGTNFGGLLPSDLDGARQPPAGSPNPILSLGAVDSQLAFWKFHVDWTTPANSTLTGPTTLTTATFTEACSGGTCIPQSGTTQQLDSLADRLMFRLAYRNFGDHESLVTNHSVTAGSSVGVRWYELRLDSSGNPSIFQQGTYAPDANFRWMGSIAQDQQGNMGLGFSLSSSSLHPQIHYTGRLAGDAAGIMTQGEGSIINGAGSQTGSSLSRWGDYSMMAVDPTDDCTFWYTNEYIPANGAFNWSTRVGTFKFPGCGGTVTDDFSISASPSSLSILPGASGSSTISTAVTSGSVQTVSLSISGLPSGASASFNPTSVTAGASSTLTVGAGTAAAGTYVLTITGTGASATHAATISLTVTGPDDFSISASPASLSILQGASGSSTISTAVTSGNAQTVSLSVSGLPSGASALFNPTSVTAGASSTLTVSAGTAAAGTYSLIVTGSGTSATHSAAVSLTVTAPVANDFSISASPTSLTLGQGASGTSTISTAVTSGSAQSVSLGISGLPSGASASFNPTSVTSGASSTLTVNAGTAAVGAYTLTITGTGASGTHSTALALSVTGIAPGGIINGGFETGDLTGWSSVRSTVVAGGHSGSFAARVGSTTPTAGDSSISQTFTVPASGGNLSFWYKVVCPDTLTYDWAVARLTDNVSGVTTAILPKTCTNTGAWVQVSRDLAANAGHSVTLTLASHDDNFPGDPTFTLYDDVTLGAPPPPPFQNGGFETGDLTSWSSVGSTAVVAAAHSGGFAARVGNTTPTNGDSSISQTFTAPAGTTLLSVWFKETCPDTVTYDWALATLRDNTAGTTATVIPKGCRTNPWTQKTAAVTAGHSYTLTLLSHDDNFAGDATFTLFDDIVLQ